MDIPPMRQCDSPTPQVLVIGLARSGTTWLAKMLDSHPATLYRHEPDGLPIFPTMPIMADRDQAAIYGSSLAEFSHALPKLERVRTSGTLPIFRKQDEGIFKFQSRRVITSAARLASNRLGNIRIPGAFQLTNADSLKVVWKSVWSVGRLGCIVQALQPIQVIFLIRHPCGVIFSRRRGVEQRKMAPVMQDEFAALIQPSSSVADRMLAKTELRDTVDWEAFRWAVLNSHALGVLRDQAGCMVVRYEDLCADPYSVMREILLGINLPWDTQVERFIRSSTASTSRRFYGLHRQEKHLDPWHRTVSTEAKKRILQIVEGTPSGEFYTD